MAEPEVSRNIREDQESVFHWCEAHYPGDSLHQKLINLLEEATELGCVLGVDPKAMQDAVSITVSKSDDPVGDATCTAKELGDVQLSVLNLAGSLKLGAMQAMQEVMLANRQRTLVQSAARSARKRAMGLRA